jgi:hypothetical protein
LLAKTSPPRRLTIQRNQTVKRLEKGVLGPHGEMTNNTAADIAMDHS